MIILGIESTCDETGVGIVRNGREILGNVVASSSEMHKAYGGIVPEVAAREQVKAIIPTVDRAFSESGLEMQDVDAIAVSYGPGLIGSLLIGVETAKTLALVFNKPLVAVNHLVAHVYANWINNEKLETGNFKLPEFPLIALIVSGGHTDLILMKDHNKFQWLGGTLDDACGEAFDKVARVLGFSYPGGPEIEKIASNFQTGNLKLEPRNIKFPRPMIAEDNFDFSFSGLKTAVVNLVSRNKFPENRYPEVAYEFQNAVCDVLVKKTLRAAEKYKVKYVVVGGGVAANAALENALVSEGRKNNLQVLFPGKNLSVDNGAMIATAAYWQKRFVNPLSISANPGL